MAEIKACTRKEWREMCNRVRSCCPPPEGYAWRFQLSSKCAKEGKAGDAERKPGKNGKRGTMWIRVAEGMCVDLTEHTLLHEVSHGYDKWDHHGWAGDHSDTFYIWLGRVERRYRGMETG